MRVFAILALVIGLMSHDVCSILEADFRRCQSELPFSAAVKADGLIYVSGTLGSRRRRQGADQAGARQHQHASLKSPGSSLANAASMTVYLRNQSDFAAMNDVYRRTGPRIRRRARPWWCRC